MPGEILGNIWEFSDRNVTLNPSKSDILEITHYPHALKRFITGVNETMVLPDWSFTSLLAEVYYNPSLRLIYTHSQKTALHKDPPMPNLLKNEVKREDGFHLREEMLDDLLVGTNLSVGNSDVNYNKIWVSAPRLFRGPRPEIRYQEGVQVLELGLYSIEDSIQSERSFIDSEKEKFLRNINPYRAEIGRLKSMMVASPMPLLPEKSPHSPVEIH